MAVQMSSPALRAENVATPSSNACNNRPKATKVTTSANCNDRTKQTDLRATQVGEEAPQRTISHPMVTLGGWSNDASQCITTAMHREWARMQHNGVAPRMQHNGVAPPTKSAPEPEALLRVNKLITRENAIVKATQTHKHW